MILLYTIFQSAIVPPPQPAEGVLPSARISSPEEWVRDRDFPDDLPDALIEFLGRRRICVELADNRGEEAEDRRRFLSCDALQSEEAEWRRLFASEAAVETALNGDSRTYRIPRIISRFDEVEPNIEVRRFSQEGVERESGTPVSVVIETHSGGRPVIRISGSRGAVAAQTVEIPAADLPNFDMSTVSIWLRPSGEHPGLSITASFGRHRGYCWDGTDDDRPEVNIFFTPEDVSASRQGWPECNPSHERLPLGRAAASQR